MATRSAAKPPSKKSGASPAAKNPPGNPATKKFRAVLREYMDRGIGRSGGPWSQEAFAAETGSAMRSVGHWKAGDFFPSKEKFDEICSLGFKLVPADTPAKQSLLFRLQEAFGMKPHTGETEGAPISANRPDRNPLVRFVPPGRDYKFARSRNLKSEVIANAIRLQGGGTDHFDAKDMAVSIVERRYVAPSGLVPNRRAILARLRRNPKFFNGPHTRMTDCGVEVSDPRTERKLLRVTLGPIDWEDFAVVRDVTDQMLEAAKTDEGARQRLLELVPIPRMIDGAGTPRDRGGSPRGAKTPCIVDTATTLITCDGWLGYAIRGNVQHFAGAATSSVAENIQREFDKVMDPAANEEMPSPFRAALRGIGEEVSTALKPAFRRKKSRLLCTGVSFDLAGLHPDVLFMALLAQTKDEVVAMPPGKDFVEGRLTWVNLENNAGIYGALSKYKWTGAGFASVVRALEVLDGHIEDEDEHGKFATRLDVVHWLRR